MKKLTFLTLSFFALNSLKAQILYIPKQENSAVTESKMKNSNYFLDKAYESYSKGEMDKTRFYLKQSEKDGYVSGRFYFLLGKWCVDMKKRSAAKRYLMRGFRKCGCWECKELALKLK